MAGGGVAGATSGEGGWSAPDRIEPQTSSGTYSPVYSVSCPSSAFCAAVD